MASQAMRTSRSASLGWIASVSSRSARNSGWPWWPPWATKRVFSVVQRPPCTSSHGSTPGWRPISPVSSEPAASSPTTETKATALPSAPRLRMTLPAPPATARSRCTFRIGTGASMLMRSTSP